MSTGKPVPVKNGANPASICAPRRFTRRWPPARAMIAALGAAVVGGSALVVMQLGDYSRLPCLGVLVPVGLAGAGMWAAAGRQLERFLKVLAPALMLSPVAASIALAWAAGPAANRTLVQGIAARSALAGTLSWLLPGFLAGAILESALTVYSGRRYPQPATWTVPTPVVHPPKAPGSAAGELTRRPLTHIHNSMDHDAALDSGRPNDREERNAPDRPPSPTS